MEQGMSFEASYTIHMGKPQRSELTESRLSVFFLENFPFDAENNMPINAEFRILKIAIFKSHAISTT